jgi:hypothetical protein
MKLTIAIGLLLLSTTGMAAKVVPGLPCKNLETACEAGGFKKHGHQKGNGIWNACMAPLLQGTAVKGVSASSADIEGCKTARAAKGLK